MKLKIAILSCLILITMLSVHGLAKTVLVVESYHAEYPWDISYKKGLENILGKTHELVFFQMDTKRLPPSRYTRQADLAYRMYEEIQPALVILGDDNALKYLGPRLSKTPSPVVYLGINNNPRAYGINPANMTGVLERPLMKRSIIYMSELLAPRLEKLLILFDSGFTSKTSVREFFNDRNSVNVAGVRVDLKMIAKWTEWQQTVKNAWKNGYGAIVVGLYQTITDEDGEHVPALKVINWTSKNTPVPPFGFWDFTVGAEKTIGGLVLFGESQGEEAGKIAQKILSGKSPAQIPPVIGQKGRFFFSRSQLEKWQITLPEKIAEKADYTR